MTEEKLMNTDVVKFIKPIAGYAKNSRAFLLYHPHDVHIVAPRSTLIWQCSFQLRFRFVSRTSMHSPYDQLLD
ncbi:MAG: hypothetical protein Q9176_003383 [Flavoplaca citrina]